MSLGYCFPIPTGFSCAYKYPGEFANMNYFSVLWSWVPSSANCQCMRDKQCSTIYQTEWNLNHSSSVNALNICSLIRTRLLNVIKVSFEMPCFFIFTAGHITLFFATLSILSPVVLTSINISCVSLKRVTAVLSISGLNFARWIPDAHHIRRNNLFLKIMVFLNWTAGTFYPKGWKMSPPQTDIFQSTTLLSPDFSVVHQDGDTGLCSLGWRRDCICWNVCKCVCVWVRKTACSQENILQFTQKKQSLEILI